MTYEDYADLAAEMNILLRYIDDELVEKIPQKIMTFKIAKIENTKV